MSFREVEGHVDFCFESLNAGGLISAKECKIAPRPVSKVTFPPGGMVPGHGSTTCGQKVA